MFRTIKMMAVVVSLSFLLAGCSVSNEVLLAQAVKNCNLDAQNVMDEVSVNVFVPGRRMEMMVGKEYWPENAASGDDVECLLDQVGAPPIISSRIGMTVAADGVQSDEWEGWQALWSFNAQSGLDITITDMSY